MTELWRILRAMLQCVAKTIAGWNSVLLLTLLFYGAFLPISLLRRLARKSGTSPRWIERDRLDREHFRRQF